MLLFIVIALFVIWFVLKGLCLVHDDEVGIVTKKMFGKPLSQGKIIATEGEVGVQADILMPGLYFRIPFIWSIKRANVTEIPAGKIGVIESIEGKPIPTGRLLGDEVSCDSFQNAKAFLQNGGCRGPQVSTLRPGTYRINTSVFSIELKDVIEVSKESVGVVVALDGVPLPSGYSIAPEPTCEHRHFQDGQSFLSNGGYRGPQLETLQPGEYYINPWLFEVNRYDVSVVNPGYVAVIISNVGKELERPRTMAPSITADPNLAQPVHEVIETPLITSKNERGILREPVAPGKYNLNKIAYRAELVPTSAITIDWAERTGIRETKITTTSPSDLINKFTPSIGGAYLNCDDSKFLGAVATADSEKYPSHEVSEFFRYSQLKFTSKDGFQLEVDVRLIIRIPPANAPFVISRFGTVNNLIEQVAHPLIDSSFRNEAGNRAAMDFVHSRSEIQTATLEKVRGEFMNYHVEVQGLLIAYIKVDEKLLETQTRKEIAKQQQQQYNEEARAQDARIAVAEKTARGDKQADVIAAKLSIEISADKADALRKEAEGIRDSTKIKADGTAYESEMTGVGIAKAYQAQADAIGQERVAAIKMLQQIAEGKIVVTPQMLVQGDGGQSGTLLNALLAKALFDQK